MLKHAADLSDSHEYFIVWVGETSARPWGTKTEGYTLFPEFENAVDGVDLTGLTVPGTTADGVSTVAATCATALKANQFANATIRLGTVTSPVLGYGVIQSHAAIAAGESGNLKVKWTETPGSDTGVAAYIVRDNAKWRSYPQVRVLTPFQPVDAADSMVDTNVVYPTAGAAWAATDDRPQGGKSITLPAPYNGTLTANSTFEDLGLLLPLTFKEGIGGFGISESKDSTGSNTHAITQVASTGTVWTFGGTNALSANKLLNGGYVIVDWEDGGATKRSWAPITDSTTTTFTAGPWLGDGVVPNGSGAPYAAIKRYTAWVPHYDDSPYAYLPGEGFTYPNNDMMPYAASAIGANVRNRPRGQTLSSHGDKFGAMLVAASRLAAATGKRINVIHLGINESSLSASNDSNLTGFDGKVGWWNNEDHSTWATGVTTSIYQRLDKLLRSVLPNALLAESSSKTARCLGLVVAHGASDALDTSARQHYGRTLKGFVRAARSLINTLGFNPYANGAEIPYVQPRIPYLPYSIDGTYTHHSELGGGSTAINADTDSLVNSAIEENAAADGFAATVKVDDLPRNTTDVSIYNGVGEAELGSRISDKLGILVDYSLGHGSSALATTQTRLIDICNLALSSIGDSGQITSLDDGSEQAALCKKFLPEARDSLLQMRQWGFAMRRKQLVAIQRPEMNIYQHFNSCYVLPKDALNAFRVLPPVTTGATFDHNQVNTTAYSNTFAGSDGSGTKGEDVPADVAALDKVVVASAPSGDSGVVIEPDDLLPIQSHIELAPEPYAVEQSPFGHRYIFTNQTFATLQYVAKVVDADQYSPAFATALANHLGSMLAGVLIKGDQGQKVSQMLLAKTAGAIKQASLSDGNQQRPTDSDRPFGFIPDHIAHR